MSTAVKASGAKKEPFFLKLYKIGYNAGMCAGWGLVGLLMAKYYLDNWEQGTYHSGKSENNLKSYIWIPLAIFQTGAIMEVIHVFLGIVRAPLVTTFIQVLSRLTLLWGIVMVVPQIGDHIFLATMVASWTVTEVVRYGYYVFNMLNFVPYPILYLRYTLFYILYPTGAGSEFLLIIKALPFVLESELFTIRMPNHLNFMFDYYWFLVMVAAVYIPGFPEMYTHMIAQRRKNL